jgi:hypothetical protein
VRDDDSAAVAAGGDAQIEFKCEFVARESGWGVCEWEQREQRGETEWVIGKDV